MNIEEIDSLNFRAKIMRPSSELMWHKMHGNISQSVWNNVMNGIRVPLINFLYFPVQRNLAINLVNDMRQLRS